MSLAGFLQIICRLSHDPNLGAWCPSPKHMGQNWVPQLDG
jgi:hypothetical protein